ncbi:MAG: tetratricopeptide repeat protein [Verrucomicrobiia bacterium]
MVEKEKIAAPVADESSLGLELLAWLEVNKKKLIIAGVIILVVWIGGVTFVHLKRQREADASAALAALRPALGESMVTPIPAEKYMEIYEKYRGTKAAPRALLLAATSLYQTGKYQDAQKTFERFLSEYPDDAFAAQAALGVAACLEAQGKETEAASKYQEVTIRYSTETSVLIPAKIAYARLMEKQGKFDLAHSAYNDILRADMFSSWAQEAMSRVQSLEKQHPELVQARIQQQQQQMPQALKTNVVTTKTNLVVNKTANSTTITKHTNITLTVKTNGAKNK